MNISIQKKPALILCDIEGTTTSITFVKDVLFPNVKLNLVNYLKTFWNSSQTQNDLKLLQDQYLKDRIEKNDLPVIEYFCQSDSQSMEEKINDIVHYVNWQMDRDKKSTALKQLQGNIWTHGYTSGKFKGHIYDDVPECFERWTKEGILIGIYSSGSVLAQKLLFSHSIFGDLTKYITYYFDTEIGFKRETSSYQKISHQVGLEPGNILFLTDVFEEAKAAASSHMESILLEREGVILSEEAKQGFKFIKSFDQIFF